MRARADATVLVATLLLAMTMSSAACSKCRKEAPIEHSSTASSSREYGDDGGASEPLVDLLHFTDAHLAVSSKVDNPLDRAEHIADGRFGTAWNGRTGDLVGGWFAFRVPRVTVVRFIDVTVGFDARSRKGEDLFTTNHRIQKVRVTRDGLTLLEHTFDPDARGLQRIALPLETGGGDFKLEVLEVKPGSRPAWRELVVSELRVIGFARGAKRKVAGLPRVSVGAFDDREPLALSGAPSDGGIEIVDRLTRGDSAPALCAAWQASAIASWQAEKPKPGAESEFCPWEVREPHCQTSPIASERGVTLHALTTSGTEGLAIEYQHHAYSLSSVIQSHSPCDPGCAGPERGGEFVGFRVEGTTIAVIVYTTWIEDDRLAATLPDGSAGEWNTHYTKHEVHCKLASTQPECEDLEVDEKDVKGSEGPRTPQEWAARWTRDAGP